MKKCKRCGKEKPEDSFEVVGVRWRRGICKECRAIYVKGWNERSKDHLQRCRKEYYKAHREETIAKASEWNKKHPERHCETSLAYYYRLQGETISAYGGDVCACCGETEPLFLSLDHVENNGRDHRKKFPISGAKLYKWLKDHGYPPGYQVLCMNCNHGKYRNNGVCPHHG